MALIDDVKRILQAGFPGAKLELKSIASGRVTGALIWDGFDALPQIDRQSRLRKAISALPVDKQLKVSLILTLTTDEKASLAAA